MSYIPIEQLKNAWIFKHKSLPISDNDLCNIKPMAEERSIVLWDTFISKHVDHPDFFTEKDWPGNPTSWKEQVPWEKRWDSEEPQLPEEITESINWDNNTVIYFCTSRLTVIETTWSIFKRCWKNFLFMDDGSILIGKKRKEAVQFLSNGQCKIGLK